jgi:DNA-binding beta-propeller fold protein YncE
MWAIRVSLVMSLLGAAIGMTVTARDAVALAPPGTAYDVSYPQCNGSFPATPAFGIVGVNDGLPYSPNPCVGTGDGPSELQWAGKNAEFYANTANPGPTLSTHWPNGQTSPEYCDPNSNNTAQCAYDYGWNAAADSYGDAVAAYVSLGWAQTGATRTPVANAWWLDVETANSWTSDTGFNVDVLQAEVDYLKSVGAVSVGFYSTSSQWQTITGGTSSFAAHKSWIPGAKTLTQAKSNCTGSGFTGGGVTLTQYPSGGFDADYQCVPSVTSIATVAMPDTSPEPTGITVDPAGHVAYVAESSANGVAEITGTNGTSFPATATEVSDPGSCTTTCALPGLNFPDDLTVDASGHVFATNFCVGSQANVCASEPAATTTTVSQQTGASSGQRDAFPNCSYPAGDAVFTPSGGSNALFVACAGSGTVAECSPGGGTPGCGIASPNTVPVNRPGGGSQPVPSGVADVSTETTTPAVIVADARNSTLSVVSFNGSALSTSVPSQLASGCDPAYVAVGPASAGTASVYVACPGNGTIEVGTISATTLGSFTATSLPTTGTSSPSPYGIAVNSTGTLLMVSDSANNDAVVYPSLSGTTLGANAVVSTGAVPDGVAIDGTNAFVANEASGTVSVIDPSSPHQHGHAVPARGAQPSVSRAPLIAPIPGWNLPSR